MFYFLNLYLLDFGKPKMRQFSENFLRERPLPLHSLATPLGCITYTGVLQLHDVTIIFVEALRPPVGEVSDAHLKD